MRKRRREIARIRNIRLQMYREGRYPDWMLPVPVFGDLTFILVIVAEHYANNWHRLRVYRVQDWSELDAISADNRWRVDPIVIECAMQLPDESIILIRYASRLLMFGFRLVD